MFPTAHVEVLSQADLSSGEEGTVKRVRQTISAAFGPTGLGIILVRDLPPTYSDLRKQLLDAGNALPFIPEEELKALELPSVHYAVGWSRGREQFNGVLDYSKGSFFANAQFDDPSLGQHHVVEKYPYVQQFPPKFLNFSR